MDSADQLEAKLATALARGPAGAPELARALGLSQPSFSRLVKRARDRLLVAGRARATRYALRRTVAGVGERTSIYEIGEDGAARTLGTLHAIEPSRFYFEAAAKDAESAFYDDLPYFLNELRPSGFLGRLIPHRHPELELPSDIRLWSADHCLKYVTTYGWDLTGSFIAGDAAFRLYLENTRSPARAIALDERSLRYPALAADVLGQGRPGSSAAGEQPKFLATTEAGPVLVKFSPPVTDATSRRLADLLIAEHLALETLRTHGRDAAKSELVYGMDRTFLEVARFDRTPCHGRRGMVSLLAFDAEFVGRLRTWSDSAEHLHRLGIIDQRMVASVRWLELFGRLTANTDLHGGNLSFSTRGTTPLAVAPAYDMGPSWYAPRQGHLDVPEFQPRAPEPADAPLWNEVSKAAADVWSAVEGHPGVSADFRAVARANRARVAEWRALARRLPESDPSSAA